MLSSSILHALGRWSDDFSYSGALRAPWKPLRGSWSATGSVATSSTPRTQHPLAAVPWPSSRAVIRASLAGGSGAIYPRVLDANNWIRLRWRRFTEAIEVTEYEWQNTYSGTVVSPTDDPSHVDHNALFAFRWSASNTTPPSFPSSASHDGHSHPTNNDPVLTGSTRTTTAQSSPKDNLIHERMQGGSIVESTSVAAVLPLAWVVDLTPTTIALRGIHTFTTSLLWNTPYVGIGFGPSELFGTSVDNFSVAHT